MPLVTFVTKRVEVCFSIDLALVSCAAFGFRYDPNRRVVSEEKRGPKSILLSNIYPALLSCFQFGVDDPHAHLMHFWHLIHDV